MNSHESKFMYRNVAVVGVTLAGVFSLEVIVWAGIVVALPFAPAFSWHHIGEVRVICGWQPLDCASVVLLVVGCCIQGPNHAQFSTISYIP